MSKINLRLSKYRWELANRLQRGRVLYIKPTMRCNLKCPYCAVNKAHGRAPKYEEMNIGYWITLIKREKPKLLVISGGEPALYYGLASIVNCAVKQKCRVRIFTNLVSIAEFRKIHPSWRVIFLSTYHEVCPLDFYLKNYNTLSQLFYINVREMREKGDKTPRRIPLSHIMTISVTQSETPVEIYAPNGVLYHSCKELDENGR